MKRTPLILLLLAGPAVLLSGSTGHAAMRIGGFTDYSFFATDDESARTSSGIREGQFVLHMTSPLSDQLSFFAELTWTPSADGFGTEVERSILTYRYNDAIKPSVGRFHTPVSWWNVAFHHGAWLQTSVDRPITVKFGSKFTPIHFVGGMLEGTVFPSGMSLDYAGGIGNGRGEHVERAGDAGDADNHRAALARLALRLDALYALQVGGAIYVDRFLIEDDGSESDERMLSGFVVYASETPELIAEIFHIRHDDEVTGRVSESTSYYAQAACRLPWASQLLKPYARFEVMDIDDGDRAFRDTVPDLRRILAGVRVDVAPTAALKFEWRRVREDNEDTVNEAFTSACLVF